MTFKARLAGAQVAQTVGPLRRALVPTAVATVPAAEGNERYLMVTEASADAPELVQTERPPPAR